MQTLFRFPLILSFLYSSIFAETTEEKLSMFIDLYRLNLELSDSFNNSGGCPKLLLSSLKDTELIFRRKSLWRDVTAVIRIKYATDGLPDNNARWFGSTTVLPYGSVVSKEGLVDSISELDRDAVRSSMRFVRYVERGITWRVDFHSKHFV